MATKSEPSECARTGVGVLMGVVMPFLVVFIVASCRAVLAELDMARQIVLRDHDFTTLAATARTLSALIFWVGWSVAQTIIMLSTVNLLIACFKLLQDSVWPKRVITHTV